MNTRRAFTMIELVFVIVIIGILSAIAIPKFAATRDDAIISKGISTLSAVRSAIATERQKRILQGKFSKITGLGAGFSKFEYDDGTTGGSVLEYPLTNCSAPGCWSGTKDSYTFHYNGGTCAYSLSNNRFTGECSVFGSQQ